MNEFNSIGQQIGAYFESLFSWEINKGIFYINGRDVGWLIVGFIICLILWGIFDGKEIRWRTNSKS